MWALKRPLPGTLVDGGFEKAIGGGIEKAIGGGIDGGIGSDISIYVHYNMKMHKYYINPAHEHTTHSFANPSSTIPDKNMYVAMNSTVPLTASV